MSNRRTVRSVGIIAVLVTLIAVIMYVFGLFDTDAPKKQGEIPSSNQLLFGMKYTGECEYDRLKLETNVLSDERFVGYSIRSEYCMAYLAKDAEEVTALKDFLGIDSELPEGNYEGRNVLISIGRKIAEMDDTGKKKSDEGKKIIDISWEEEYTEGKAYVYSIRNTDFVAGADLEMLYFETVDPRCNMVEDLLEDMETVSQGRHHRMYKKAEKLYEYVMLKKETGEIVYRGLSAEQPEITEHSDKAVKIKISGSSRFYNPTTGEFSDIVPYEVKHVVNDIIAYVRVYESEIILIIRSAYDKMAYGNAFMLPFTKDFENTDSVFKSIRYIDASHVEVEYYTGDERKLAKLAFVVPYMGENEQQELN